MVPTRLARSTQARPTRRLVLSAVLLSCIGRIAQGATGFADARSFVETMGQAAVGVLRDPALTDDQKLEKLIELLNSATDLGLVAKLVLGRYWRDASDPQRQEYLGLFNRLVIGSMARRMARYAGGDFEIAGVRVADERDSIVSTRIFSGRSPVPTMVDWRVRRDADQFKVVDVVVEGVSMVVTQRSEAADIVARSGIDGLLRTMRERSQA